MFTMYPCTIQPPWLQCELNFIVTTIKVIHLLVDTGTKPQCRAGKLLRSNVKSSAIKRVKKHVVCKSPPYTEAAELNWERQIAR